MTVIVQRAKGAVQLAASPFGRAKGAVQIKEVVTAGSILLINRSIANYGGIRQ